MGFFDDLVNDQNYRNAKLLDKIRQDFNLAQALIDPGGYRFVTGTRYAFGDLYEEILRWQAKSGKWVITVKTCWTDKSAGIPDAQKIVRFPRYTKKNGEIGGFTHEDLLQMQSDDPANFACQYLNQPIHSSQQAYTKEMLYQAVIPAAETPNLSYAMMVIDLASSDAVKADDSVIQIGKIDTLGCAYLCDQRGDQWTPMDLALNAIQMALIHRPQIIYLEKSAAGMIFESFLRMVARSKGIYLPLDYIKVDNRPDAKNMRVVSLAGIVKKGKFKFLAGLPKFDQLVEQAIEFPKGRYGHDDYIDTAALLYQKLSEEFMTLPVRPAAKDPIIALMNDRENALIKVLTEQEQREVDQPDQTGLE
jgi:hypothetical protein